MNRLNGAVQAHADAGAGVGAGVGVGVGVAAVLRDPMRVAARRTPGVATK